MKSELHTSKSFRKDYKKLAKSEIEDMDNVINNPDASVGVLNPRTNKKTSEQ